MRVEKLQFSGPKASLDDCVMGKTRTPCAAPGAWFAPDVADSLRTLRNRPMSTDFAIPAVRSVIPNRGFGVVLSSIARMAARAAYRVAIGPLDAPAATSEISERRPMPLVLHDFWAKPRPRKRSSDDHRRTALLLVIYPPVDR
jgi:hypothetical protein